MNCPSFEQVFWAQLHHPNGNEITRKSRREILMISIAFKGRPNFIEVGLEREGSAFRSESKMTGKA